MLCLLSKMHGVTPSVRGFVYRLCSSSDKPPRFEGIKKITQLKKKCGPTKEKIKSKPKAKRAVKKPSVKSRVQSALCKKPSGISPSDSKIGGGQTGSPSEPQKPSGYYTFDKCDMIETPKTNSKLFGKISYSLISLIAVFSAYLFTHEEEKEYTFVPYEYKYKRLKRFFFRDGRTTLFHGPNNFIKDDEKYEAKPDTWLEDDLERRRKLRDQHAKEELERRRERHEQEKQIKNTTDEENITPEGEETTVNGKNVEIGENGKNGKNVEIGENGNGK